LITSEQIRAARSFLRMTVVELASLSGVGIATIKRLEACKGVPAAHAKTLDSLGRALEKAGVDFIGSPDDRPGVRLKEPRKG
jgi:transcriptional regulator with XRE-family HTH domain